MLELAPDLLPRLRGGERIAVVTVTRVARSAPRGVGASMAVTASGEVIGSISGGCVEGDAVTLALQAIATGKGLTATFGFSDAEAHAAGLACGGRIAVIAYPITSEPVTVSALEAVLRDEAVAVGLVTSTGVGRGSDHAFEPALGTVVPATVALSGDDVLTLSYAPRPRLIILGAGDYAAALSRVAAAAGHAVTVCDAWEILVTRERFPDADELVVASPPAYLRSLAERLDPRTAVCVLTHDEREDVPALREALRLPVAFVGALGARRTVARRAELLRAQGVTDEALGRLHSPLGFDLGAETPEETAISILAEIVAARRSGTGAPLRALATPIHPVRKDDAAALEARSTSSCSTLAPIGGRT